MFLYLLLIAAIASSSTEQISIEAITPQEQEQLQEIIALLNQEDAPQEVTAATTSAVETVTVAPAAITITNGIEPNMLAYKHWTGTYSPETFTIAINGTEVAQGSSHTLPAATKTMDIQYNYSFMNGMRTGAKKVSYELHENSTQATITFSWKDTWKVLVDNGTAVKEEVI